MKRLIERTIAGTFVIVLLLGTTEVIASTSYVQTSVEVQALSTAEVMATPRPTPTPPPPRPVASSNIQGEPFFEILNHFQEVIPDGVGMNHRGAIMHVGTVTSLGVRYTNALHLTGAAPRGARDYNLNGQFTTLTGTVLRLDSGGWGFTITFIGDGRTLGAFQANLHDQPRPISVDVTGVSVLRIHVDGTWVALSNVGIQRCTVVGIQPPGNIVVSHGEPFFATVSHFHEGPFQIGPQMSLIATYSLGVRYENSLVALGRRNTWDTPQGYRDFNLSGQFSYLVGTIVPRDNGGGFGSLTFTGDGQRLDGFSRGSFDYHPVQQPVPITIDVRGVNILRISINNRGFAFTNATIYRVGQQPAHAQAHAPSAIIRPPTVETASRNVQVPMPLPEGIFCDEVAYMERWQEFGEWFTAFANGFFPDKPDVAIFDDTIGRNNIFGWIDEYYYLYYLTNFHILHYDNSLWAWGENVEGRLGDGTFINRYAPVKVLSNVFKFSVFGYGVALRYDGALLTWGRYGGIGRPVISYTPGIFHCPTPTIVLHDVVSFVAGHNIVVLMQDGIILTFGDAPLPILDNATQISRGRYMFSDSHMALRNDGSLWAWGIHFETGSPGSRDENGMWTDNEVIFFEVLPTMIVRNFVEPTEFPHTFIADNGIEFTLYYGWMPQIPSSPFHAMPTPTRPAPPHP